MGWFEEEYRGESEQRHESKRRGNTGVLHFIQDDVGLKVVQMRSVRNWVGMT